MISDRLFINVIMRNNGVIASVRIHRVSTNIRTGNNSNTVVDQVLRDYVTNVTKNNQLYHTASSRLISNEGKTWVGTRLYVTRLNFNDYLLRRGGHANITTIILSVHIHTINGRPLKTVFRRLRQLISTLRLTVRRSKDVYVDVVFYIRTKTNMVDNANSTIIDTRRINSTQREVHITHIIRNRRLYTIRVLTNLRHLITMSARLTRNGTLKIMSTRMSSTL